MHIGPCQSGPKGVDLGLMYFRVPFFFQRNVKTKNNEQIPIEHALFRSQNLFLIDDRKENVR